MNTEDRPRFAAMMTALSEYYRAEITRPVLEIYWRSLSPFDFADVERAAQLHIERGEAGQFMPKVADLIKLIEGSAEQRALQAWSSFINAARRTNYGRTLVFEDALIMGVAQEMGGLEAFGNMTARTAPFMQSEFIKRYSAHDVRGVLPPHPAQISHDASAHLLPPVLVGRASGPIAITHGGSRPALPIGKSS